MDIIICKFLDKWNIQKPHIKPPQKKSSIVQKELKISHKTIRAEEIQKEKLFLTMTLQKIKKYHMLLNAVKLEFPSKKTHALP
jgi:hypothetical protein